MVRMWPLESPSPGRWGPRWKAVRRAFLAMVFLWRRMRNIIFRILKKSAFLWRLNLQRALLVFFWIKKLPADVNLLKVDVPSDATVDTPWQLTRVSHQR